MLFTTGAGKIFNKAIELNRRYFLKHSYTVGSDHIFLAFLELKHPLAEHFLAHFRLEREKLVRRICQEVLPLSNDAIEENAQAYFEEIQKRLADQNLKLTSEWHLFRSIFEMVTSATLIIRATAPISDNSAVSCLSSPVLGARSGFTVIHFAWSGPSAGEDSITTIAGTLVTFSRGGAPAGLYTIRCWASDSAGVGCDTSMVRRFGGPPHKPLVQ